MPEISYIGGGRVVKPSWDDEVILRLTTAGCSYCSSAGGTRRGRRQGQGLVHLVEYGATAESVWQVQKP